MVAAAGTTTVRVVIAGGGIIGTSVAYFLSSLVATSSSLSTIDLTLVDPAGTVAPAASAKAGGFLAASWRDGTDLEEMQRKGFALHQTLADSLGADRIQYRRLECYNVVVGKQADQSQQTTNNVEKESSSNKNVVSWADLNVIETSLMGQTDVIAQVHPHKLCQALWEETCQRGNATLRKGRIVKAHTNENTTIQYVQLEDGTMIPADVLVCACGPWSHEIRGWFDESIATHIPLITSVKCHSMLVRAQKSTNRQVQHPLKQAVFFTSLDPSLIHPEADVEVYPRPDGDCYVNGYQGEEGLVTETPGEEAVVARDIESLCQAMQHTSSVLGNVAPHTTQVSGR
jgi:glycine/D-amino acid oxidase-like deaminating enzyme